VELASTEGVVPLLVASLRDGAHVRGRMAAAHGMMWLAKDYPVKRKALAKAGVIRLLLAFFIEEEELARNMSIVTPAWQLAQELLKSEGAAMRDLQRAMCGSRPDLAFAALDVLEVRPPSPTAIFRLLVFRGPHVCVYGIWFGVLDLEKRPWPGP
jgi:hypothetical protein